MGQNYPKMEDQKPWPVLAKVEGLNQNLKRKNG